MMMVLRKMTSVAGYLEHDDDMALVEDVTGCVDGDTREVLYLLWVPGTQKSVTTQAPAPSPVKVDVATIHQHVQLVPPLGVRLPHPHLGGAGCASVSTIWAMISTKVASVSTIWAMISTKVASVSTIWAMISTKVASITTIWAMISTKVASISTRCARISTKVASISTRCARISITCKSWAALTSTVDEKLSLAATDDSEVASTVPYGLSFTLGGRTDVGGGILLVYLLESSLDVQLDLG